MEKPISTSKFKFTDSKLLALKPPPDMTARGIEFSDAEVVGLKLALGASGHKSFGYRYKRDGQSRYITIGRFPDTSLAQARERARAYRAAVDRGDDPRAEIERRRETPSFQSFVEAQYLPWAEKSKRSVENDRSKFQHHLLPRFGRQRLDHITRRDVETYLLDLRTKPGQTTGKPLSAATINRHLTLLSAVFRQAVLWEMIARNPCTGLRQQQENNQRQRFLSTEEFACLLRSARAKSGAASEAIQVLLLTGMRRQECLDARWADIDLEAANWHLPHTKSGRARDVALGDTVVELLQRMRLRRESEWVFPGRNNTGPLTEIRKTLRSLLTQAGIDDHLRVHDLRHAFASTAARAGVSLYKMQEMLGHSTPQMTQRYAHLQNDELRRSSQMVADAVEQSLQATMRTVAAVEARAVI